MAQKPVEIILMRQLASYLAMPILLVDQTGTLVYYNEPAETLLGRRYEETGEMPLEEWSATFELMAEDGSPILSEDRPVMRALRKHQAVHRRVRIRGANGILRTIETTAFALEGQGGRRLGAVSIFWEATQP